MENENFIFKKMINDRNEQSKRHEHNTLIYDRKKEIDDLILNYNKIFNFNECKSLTRNRYFNFIIDMSFFEILDSDSDEYLLKKTIKNIENKLYSEFIKNIKDEENVENQDSESNLIYKYKLSEFDRFLIKKVNDIRMQSNILNLNNIYKVKLPFLNLLRKFTSELYRKKKKYFLYSRLPFRKIYIYMVIFKLDYHFERLIIKKIKNENINEWYLYFGNDLIAEDDNVFSYGFNDLEFFINRI